MLRTDTSRKAGSAVHSLIHHELASITAIGTVTVPVTAFGTVVVPVIVIVMVTVTVAVVLIITVMAGQLSRWILSQKRWQCLWEST